jgi:hypothetical protein
MTESKFEVALSTLSGHISQASQLWFAGATINEVSKDPKTNAAIQITAGFWICARLALEQQAIVVVGKIFGQRSTNPTNIDSFFEVLRESRLTVFSREAVVARKRHQMPTITDSQLADLLKTARMPIWGFVSASADFCGSSERPRRPIHRISAARLAGWRSRERPRTRARRTTGRRVAPGCERVGLLADGAGDGDSRRGERTPDTCRVRNANGAVSENSPPFLCPGAGLGSWPRTTDRGLPWNTLASRRST